MMHFTTQGIVLREVDYKDNDRILTVLSRDRGKLTLRARGVKQKSSPLKSGCQLLAFSEFTVFENRGYLTINEAVPQEMFTPLRNDIEKMALASYFAQVTETLARENDADPQLLSLCLNCLYALSTLQKPQLMVKSVFEFRAACLSGYMPDLSGCAVCGGQEELRFCTSSGVLLCSSCPENEDTGIRLPLTSGMLSALRHIAFCDAKALFSFSVGEETINRLSDLTETYLLIQLERGFFTLDFYKSLIIAI